MNKSFWLGYVVIFVVAQVIGFAIHEVMLASTYEALAAVFRPEAAIMDMMWIMFLSSGVALLLFCYIFTKGYENRGIAEGVRYGALMGLFLSFPYTLDQFVVYPITASLTAIWLVTGVLTFMVLGGIFAAIYRPVE